MSAARTHKTQSSLAGNYLQADGHHVIRIQRFYCAGCFLNPRLRQMGRHELTVQPAGAGRVRDAPAGCRQTYLVANVLR